MAEGSSTYSPCYGTYLPGQPVIEVKEVTLLEKNAQSIINKFFVIIFCACTSTVSMQPWRQLYDK